MIHQKARIGNRTKLWYPDLSNIGDCEIGQDCVIHSHVWIGDGVKIGHRVRIQAFSFIPTGVTIEDDAFIGPGVIFTNDSHLSMKRELWKETKVLQAAKIGANTTIIAGVIIGRFAFIGAGSVVTRDIPHHALAYGVPARLQIECCPMGCCEE